MIFFKRVSYINNAHVPGRLLHFVAARLQLDGRCQVWFVKLHAFQFLELRLHVSVFFGKFKYALLVFKFGILTRV